MSTADTPVPTTLGSKDRAYSHHPQHPKGTSEKNEKKEVVAVLPEFPPNAFVLTLSLHPNSLLFSERNICRPIPIPIPIITTAFS